MAVDIGSLISSLLGTGTTTTNVNSPFSGLLNQISQEASTRGSDPFAALAPTFNANSLLASQAFAPQLSYAHQAGIYNDTATNQAANQQAAIVAGQNNQVAANYGTAQDQIAAQAAAAAANSSRTQQQSSTGLLGNLGSILPIAGGAYGGYKLYNGWNDPSTSVGNIVNKLGIGTGPAPVQPISAASQAITNSNAAVSSAAAGNAMDQGFAGPQTFQAGDTIPDGLTIQAPVTGSVVPNAANTGFQASSVPYAGQGAITQDAQAATAANATASQTSGTVDVAGQVAPDVTQGVGAQAAQENLSGNIDGITSNVDQATSTAADAASNTADQISGLATDGVENVASDAAGSAVDTALDTAGDALPGIGSLFSLGNAGNAFANGDIGGGFLGLAEAIPVVGPIIGGLDSIFSNASVICTAMKDTGSMSKEMWLLGTKHFYENYSETAIKSYHKWAMPMADHIRKHPTSLVSKIFSKLFNARSQYVCSLYRPRKYRKTFSNKAAFYTVEVITWTVGLVTLQWLGRKGPLAYTRKEI